MRINSYNSTSSYNRAKFYNYKSITSNPNTFGAGIGRIKKVQPTAITPPKKAGILDLLKFSELEIKQIFKPDKKTAKPVPEHLRDKMKILETETSDGLKLRHYYFPVEDKSRKTVIFCHGQGHNVTEFFHVADFLHKNNYNAVLMEYRGFETNSGKPSEKGLYKDLHSVVKKLNGHKVPKNNIVLWGFSLGGGVVAEEARKDKFAGLVLNSTFSDMKSQTKYLIKAGKVVQGKVLQNVVAWPIIRNNLIKSRFDNAEKISHLNNTEILIIHAKNDKKIPQEMAKKNARMNPKAQLHLEDKGGHTCEEWAFPKILEFLNSLD